MAKPNSIKAVIFDLGGVIVRTHDWSSRTSWENRLGLKERELSDLVFMGEMGLKAAIGKASTEEVWQWVSEKLTISSKDQPRLIKDFWRGDRVDHRLVEFIRDLRGGFRTGMISNAFSDLRSALADVWKIADAFDDIVISAEVGLLKPDPQIYHISLDNLGVTPAEAIFVDDMQENVDGALKVGLAGVLFQDTDQTILSIQELINSSQ